MRNERRLLVFLALALAVTTILPAARAANISIKGIAYKPNGSTRPNAQIFVSVKTHEAAPASIGGSEANSIPTGPNGNYLLTYNDSMLGPSKMINITFRLSGSASTRTIGPISGIAPPMGFGHMINAIVPD
jgi:hypothetical protein